MLKQLFLFSLILYVPGLYAMQEQPEENREVILRFIQEENLPELQQLIQSGKMDPNVLIENPHPWRPWVINLETPLELAVEIALKDHVSELKVVQYLLPLSNDKVVLGLLPKVLASYRGSGTEGDKEIFIQRKKLEEMFMNEARKRKLNDEALEQATFSCNERQVRFLLNSGANRAKGDLIQGLIQIRKMACDDVEYHYADKMIRLLRTYAPDLKTRMALYILNLLREGKVSQQDLSRIPLDVLELIAKLASVDPEAQEKWIELGMPLYPYGFKALPENGEGEEF